MGNNENIAWLVSLAAAALLLLLFRKFRKGAVKARADEGERAPVQVEGSTAFTGMHNGVKYWIYFDNKQSRLEIEMGEEITAPFLADRRAGAPKMPGDARDADVLELFKLRAHYVEVAATGKVIAAQFPENVLNANAASVHAPGPDEKAANKIAELLAAVREKSRKPGPSGG